MCAVRLLPMPFNDGPEELSSRGLLRDAVCTNADLGKLYFHTARPLLRSGGGGGGGGHGGGESNGDVEGETEAEADGEGSSD
jgi:hypothetical protein